MFARNGDCNSPIRQSRGKIAARCRHPTFAVYKMTGFNQLLRGVNKSVVIIHFVDFQLNSLIVAQQKH
jgi:hypothetical protein